MLMSLPKLSIVTTSFNQAAYLERTIQSVLGQGYPDLEYIIIDGGSTDGSQEIIRKYEKHLAYWTSEKDSGMYDGIRKGFERSTGEIMAWINSDDIYHAGAFFVVGEIFSRLPEVHWIQGIPSVIDEEGRIVLVKNFRKWSKYHYLLGDKDHIQQESTFWRRSLWEKAGGRLDTSLKLAGDYELWMRFFRHAKLHGVRTVLGAFRMRSKNQLSLDRLDEYNREVAAVLDARLADLAPEEQETLRQIKRHQEPSRIALLQKKDPAAYEALFDFPVPISFDRKNNVFRLGDIQPPQPSDGIQRV